MVGYLRLPQKTQRLLTGGLLIATLGVLSCFASVTMSGTKTGAVLSLGATLGPFLLYAAIFSPVVFPFGLYALITPLDTLLTLPGFGTVTKLVGLATAGAFLFYMIRTKRGVQPPPVAATWLIFYLWVTSTLWWAIDTETSLKILPTAWSLAVLFLVTSMFRPDQKMLRIAVGAVFLGGVMSALYGFYWWHSGGASLANTGGRLWIQTDEGTQINPSHFADAFILPSTIALVAALRSRRMFTKLLFAGALVVMLGAMALTGGRGGMVGFAAVVVYLLIKDRRHRVQLAVLTALGGIAGVGVAWNTLVYRFSIAASTAGAGRLYIWRTGLEAFKHYWLLGAGYYNFPLAYDKFYLTVFQLVDQRFNRAAHNILLQTAVETGIIGLALLITGWVQMYKLLDPVPETDYRYSLKLALQGSILGLFVAGMFVDVMLTKYLWLVFMLAVMTYNAAPVRVAALSGIRKETTEVPVAVSA